MLVCNVNLMKHPESIDSSRVRLTSLDHVYRGRAHSLYFSGVSDFVFRHSLMNRECRIPCENIAIGLDQSAGQMIQSTSQVVDRITGDQREIQRWSCDSLNPVDLPVPLLVSIDDELVRVRFKEVLGLRLELTDVVFGPFDFCPNLPHPV